MKLRLTLLLFPLLLLACAAPPPPAPPAAPEVRLDPAALRNEAAALPGVDVAAAEPLTLSYPGAALFAEGAVLPLPGGTAVLDPLVAFLLAHPELHWAGTVRSGAAASQTYGAELAEKRLELLARFFRGRGVAAGQLQLTAEVGEGVPFELSLAGEGQSEAASPATSLGEKR